jgi:hypothetical protein
MSSETAMSPARPLAEGAAGKDNTSVGWFFSRKREFKCRILEFPVIKTLTSPRRPAAELALSTKLASIREFSLGGFRSKMIIGLLNLIRVHELSEKQKEDAKSVLLINTVLFRRLAHV